MNGENITRIGDRELESILNEEYWTRVNVCHTINGTIKLSLYKVEKVARYGTNTKYLKPETRKAKILEISTRNELLSSADVTPMDHE